METQIAKNAKEVAHFGVHWEKTYGYSQAVRVGNTIYLAGQVSHDDSGHVIGPATLTVRGARPTPRTWNFRCGRPTRTPRKS